MKAKTVRIRGELKEVEKYRILKPLGEGGIGVVYLAQHKELEHFVAIKELLETTKLFSHHLIELFEQEAKLSAKLSVHPNIIKVMDILHDEEKKFYIVMEYISREGYDKDGYPLPAYTLEDLIKKGMDESTAIDIFKKICDGIRFAHKNRIVHRDLKPTNILIGQYNQVKISDFGIAKVLKEGAKKSRMSFRVGTYAYMAPEQLTDEIVGYFSDIYALGIMFFEMLTNEYPYEIKKGSDTEYMDAHRFAKPRLEHVKNPHLRKIIEKCLEKDYRIRYQTIDELLKDLDKPYKTVPKVKVPLVVGKTKDEGLKELKKSGLKYKIKYSEGKKDCIVAQDIPEGEYVYRDTEIVIFVGKGEKVKESKKPVKRTLKIKKFVPFALLIILIAGGIIYFSSKSNSNKKNTPHTYVKGTSNRVKLKKCPKCGQLYDINIKYCSFCEENDKPMSLKEVVMPEDSLKICPECGLYFPLSVEYCSYHKKTVKLIKLSEYKKQHSKEPKPKPLLRKSGDPRDP